MRTKLKRCICIQGRLGVARQHQLVCTAARQPAQNTLYPLWWWNKVMVWLRASIVYLTIYSKHNYHAVIFLLLFQIHPWLVDLILSEKSARKIGIAKEKIKNAISPKKCVALKDVKQRRIATILAQYWMDNITLKNVKRNNANIQGLK